MISEKENRLETCTVCGRQIQRSADWGPDWLVDRFCSEDCSEKRLAPLDYHLQDVILELLARQSGDGFLVLEKVARLVDPLGWESLMPRAENAARRLAARGVVAIEEIGGDETRRWRSDKMRLRLPN